ncbi:MAG: peptidoglycan bridge formation glycyltransferase FemA/FemB family protein [Chloroflexota bacterium]
MWADLCTAHGTNRQTDTIQPPNTILIDLRPSLDDIMAAMKQKTRYNIRLSKKKGVTVRHRTERT